MTVADICQMQNGNGFGPEDWGTQGYPIIRIQNLNGGANFDYYSGPVQTRWLVEPGQLLFAWAGTKGVSFGPAIWSGRTGVLNQHIFKVSAREGIDKNWLYWALRHVTDRIEANAHGFKATLVHVKKSDIDRQEVLVPDLNAQRRIADALAVWEAAIDVAERQLINNCKQKDALSQAFDWGGRRLKNHSEAALRPHASDLFTPISIRRNQNAELLSVTQEQGVIPRRLLDRKVVMPEGATDSYKLVEPGDFVISLRSFEGGLEYSKFRGLVSPAYTVLRAKLPICDDFYRHYFKSRDFISRLSVAVIGIRDGKQISYDDFAFLKIPSPPIEVQRKVADVLNDAEHEIELLANHLEALKAEKRALMADLLTGKRRVRMPDTTAEPEAA
ncbi:restriction endonuclease subunit S [Herbaspirillum sp. C9C3]|uniref:restriction endonuclease subunit S n=1 Tax=Herbaspirillum sp. C9C3 TaxID=2735271 RepID=UPI001C3070CF|nr:restriction endonuclease subunit S [Herbaspirillum sp. C9C3]